MAKIIFRRIGGRIIPIRASKGFKPSKVVQQSSAKLRKEIKKKIEGRTSLQNQRVKAIEAARKSLNVKTREFLGHGSFTDTFKAAGRAVKQFTTKRGFRLDDESGFIRAARQLTLGKKGTPTFLVKTRKSEFLVQPALTESTKSSSKLKKAADALEKSGFVPADVKSSNFAIRKGKLRVIDAGGIFPKKGIGLPKLTKKQKARFKRFVISNKKRKG